MVWDTQTTPVFDKWYDGLNEAEQVEVAGMLALLVLNGPALSRPHADTLNGSKHSNMKELRGKTPGAVLRVAFAFDPRRTAVILAGGNKNGISEKRFYRSLVSMADTLFDGHLSVLKKK